MTDVGQHAKHNSGQPGLHQEGGVWCVDAKTFVDVTFIDTSSHSRKVVTREGQACPEQGCGQGTWPARAWRQCATCRCCGIGGSQKFHGSVSRRRPSSRPFAPRLCAKPCRRRACACGTRMNVHYCCTQPMNHDYCYWQPMFVNCCCARSMDSHCCCRQPMYTPFAL